MSKNRGKPKSDSLSEFAIIHSNLYSHKRRTNVSFDENLANFGVFGAIFKFFEKFAKGVPLMSMSVFAIKVRSAMSVLTLFRNVRMNVRHHYTHLIKPHQQNQLILFPYIIRPNKGWNMDQIYKNLQSKYNPHRRTPNRPRYHTLPGF